MAATFFAVMSQKIATRGIIMPWQILAIVGALMAAVTFVVSLISVRRVLVLEPASVFR